MFEFELFQSEAMSVQYKERGGVGSKKKNTEKEVERSAAGSGVGLAGPQSFCFLTFNYSLVYTSLERESVACVLPSNQLHSPTQTHTHSHTYMFQYFFFADKSIKTKALLIIIIITLLLIILFFLFPSLIPHLNSQYLFFYAACHNNKIV